MHMCMCMCLYMSICICKIRSHTYTYVYVIVSYSPITSGSATHATISLKKTANEATNAYPQNPKSSAPSSTRSPGTLPHTQPGPRERPLQRANNELPKLSSKPVSFFLKACPHCTKVQTTSKWFLTDSVRNRLNVH